MSSKKRSGRVPVTYFVSEIIDQVTDDDLIDEVKERGLGLMRNTNFGNKTELYRHLCDLVESNYHCSIDDLLKRLKEKL
jgi:hypothetical protein